MEQVRFELGVGRSVSHAITADVKSELVDGTWKVTLDGEDGELLVTASGENRVATILTALCRRLGFAAKLEYLPDGESVFNG